MTPPFPELTELRALLDAVCEESITPEQVQRLEELVLSHPAAEAYYVQYMSFYADLAGQFAVLPAAVEQSLRERVGAVDPQVTQPVAEPGPLAPARPSFEEKSQNRVASGSRFPMRAALLVTTLAASLLLAIVLWQFWHNHPSTVRLAAEPTDNTVAVLHQAHGAEWEDTGLPTRPGTALPPGRLRLKSGFVHIEFYSGATVILEGPADFQLISRTEAYCSRGKLRATVPPQAQGFTIGSPKLDLVDRGTEFGLHVGGDRTEVHVFQGKVELYDPGADRKGAKPQEVTTGQGVRLDAPGKVRSIELNSAAFSTARDLAERWEADMRRHQRNWLAASTAIRQDPSLVVYYTFEAKDAWSRTLPNEASREKTHDGSIVGCSWVTGRWSGKQGLEFKQIPNRVRFQLSREFDSLTLAAWVRVDALPHRFNSLMMTDGWEEGAPHWHISDTGKLELGVQGPKRKVNAHYYSPEVFTPERIGRWVHLAVVYDADAGHVTHYVDGHVVMQEEIQFEIKLNLGDVELGNWNISTSRNNSPIRFFNGCMDEFMLFSRPLSDHEIDRLYTQGQPPS